MLYNNNSAAAVYAMERMRLSEPDEPEVVFCEACGEAPFCYVYVNEEGRVVGCDRCVTKVGVWKCR